MFDSHSTVNSKLAAAPAETNLSTEFLCLTNLAD